MGFGPSRGLLVANCELAAEICYTEDTISIVLRRGRDALVRSIATTDTAHGPSTAWGHPDPNGMWPTSHSPASLDSRGWLEVVWRPSRHTVPAATRSEWLGDEARWSACGWGPLVGIPTHLPQYHRRQAGADPLPKPRVPGWPRQRAVVSRRWLVCSWCLPGMSIYHATLLSGEWEEDPQFRKKTGSTVPRDVLAWLSNSHPRQPVWGHAIDAPTWSVSGTALAMPESHPDRPM